jgi:hypothetical protein
MRNRREPKRAEMFGQPPAIMRHRKHLTTYERRSMRKDGIIGVYLLLVQARAHKFHDIL